MNVPYTEENLSAIAREYVYNQKIHGVSGRLSDFICSDALTLRTEFDHMMGGLVVRLHAAVYGRKSDHQVMVSYPADWWQAFRERWLPKIWLQACPVLYKTVVVSADEFLPFVPPVPHTTHLIRRVYVEDEK